MAATVQLLPVPAPRGLIPLPRSRRGATVPARIVINRKGRTSSCRSPGSVARGGCSWHATAGQRGHSKPGFRGGWLVCCASQDGEGARGAASEPEPEQPAAFKRRRWGTFLGITLGYAVYYMTRLSFTYVSPFMVKDLGLSITQVGAVTSLFPMSYAFSKVVGGILGDLFSPREVFCLALLAAGLLNIAFGFSSTVWAFGGIWLANGVFQGLATPQCAKLLTTWFEPTIRGKWWAVWNTSHNIGGAAIPIAAGTAAAALGWRYGMWMPGSLAVVSAAVCYLAITDKPGDVGLAPLASSSSPSGGGGGGGGGGATKSNSAKEVLRAVWGSPTMWLLAASYFFVYAVRQGMINWAHFYLLEVKGAADARAAAIAVSGFELGGLAGNIAAGFLADGAVAACKPGEGAAGKRVQVMVLCTLGTLASLGALRSLPAGLGPATWWTFAAMGFFVYGPQLLVALVATDVVAPAHVASANGFIGWVAYLGATFSGYPVTVAVRQYGWDAYFVALFAGTVIQLLLFLPLWNLRSRQQLLEDGA